MMDQTYTEEFWIQRLRGLASGIRASNTPAADEIDRIVAWMHGTLEKRKQVILYTPAEKAALDFAAGKRESWPTRGTGWECEYQDELYKLTQRADSERRAKEEKDRKAQALADWKASKPE